MAAVRKPTAVLQFTGAHAHNPARARARENEPKPNALLGSEPPDALSADIAAAWREIVRLCPAGVLADCDVYAVEAAARLLCQMREGKPLPDTDERWTDPAIFAQFRMALNELGMTPASRSKVTSMEPKKPGASVVSFDDV
jgi:phage terminase small subunit